jgi:excisionase family DNA binding protein
VTEPLEDRPGGAQLLTIEDVADTLQCTPAYVRQLIRGEQLAAVHLGRQWRVEPGDLLAYRTRERQPARQSTLVRRRVNAGDRRRRRGP